MVILAYRVCLLSGLALLIAAGVWLVLYGNPAPAEEALVLEATEQDLGAMPVGEHTVEFTIYNRASQPYLIVGSQGS